MEGIAVRSEGDLEVVILHENQSLLASIIGPDLYEIVGQPSSQTVQIHNPAMFDHFCVLCSELFLDGTKCALVEGKSTNISLYDGAKWLCVRHPQEAENSGLTTACTSLDDWLSDCPEFRFYCGELDRHFTFSLTNKELLSLVGTSAKHSLVRLSHLLGKIDRYCRAASCDIEPQETIAVLRSLEAYSRGRLDYHTTLLTELLGGYFSALNTLIWNRWRENPTNSVNEMRMPNGVTSAVFRDMYGSVLTSRRFPMLRIREFTPVTDASLKRRYWEGLE